ncbi:hypothetical protein FJU45_09975 [Acinetobacter baumannii]|nr:hypothetical protein FJU45_09975 [Acinetobacter baumannii]
MIIFIRSTQICSQMRTKKYCTKSHNVAQYAQQHPTRLCKQLYPQIVGLLFSITQKNNNNMSYIALPQLEGNAI